MAYDLREANSLFATKLQWLENGEMYPLRTAAYDTSFKAITNREFEECHQFAIVAISNVPSEADSSETYQLVSVNEVGIVIVWTVINEESTRIIDHDLGLRPGAQLKMTQTSVIRPDGVLFRLLFPYKIFCTAKSFSPLLFSQFRFGIKFRISIVL
uniref:LTD domain-containing protein n=1 Tax=Elaeophora elaphi TaxID=1147741 RepID=A0A0R3RHV3_9BILA